MNAQAATQVIEAPKTLAKKAVRGSGPNLKTILARSEKCVAALNSDYAAMMTSEFKLLRRTASELGATNEDGQENSLKEIYTRCHDLRGLAGTFGYPLVTEVGSSLCNFIDESGARSINRVEIINTHINAMIAIVGAKATGDGGKIGQQLVRDLSQLVSSSLKKSAEVGVAH